MLRPAMFAAVPVTLIPYPRLALCLLPVSLVCFLLVRMSGEGRAALLALGRMLLQLSLVGYALTALFSIEHPAPILGVLSLMMAMAGWITLRPLGAEGRRHYASVLFGLVVGAGSVLALVTQLVLRVEPWFAPRVVIPLGGMLFAHSMNSMSVAAERFHREALTQNYEIARSAALRAGMIPSINSLMAVGLVSLPGMMTGQILSGVAPEIAARYQIMVMCMIFGSSGISIATYLWLLRSPLRAVSQGGGPSASRP